MELFHKKTVIFITILLTVFLLAGLVASGNHKSVFWEKALGVVLAPFEYGLSRVSQKVNKANSFIREISKVYHDNQQLKEENTKLRQNILMSEELLAENIRLKALLDYKKTAGQFELAVAEVIARDPGTWTNIIVINRGTSDGIEKGMIVVNDQGLIGSISSVFANSAKVQLVIDPRSAVGGLVERAESRVAAIVEGNSKKPPSPRMVNLPIDADVLTGDKIVTSGFGGIYPKGILIGEVLEVITDEIGFLKYAVLKMAVNFDKIEEVMVIKRTNPTFPPIPENEQLVTGGAAR